MYIYVYIYIYLYMCIYADTLCIHMSVAERKTMHLRTYSHNLWTVEGFYTDNCSSLERTCAVGPAGHISTGLGRFRGLRTWGSFKKRFSTLMPPGKCPLREGRVARSPAEALPHAGHRLWMGGPGGRKKQLIINQSEFGGLRAWLLSCTNRE